MQEQRPARTDPTHPGDQPSPTRLDLRKGLRIARAMTVTSGGPVTLALASALAPAALLGRWPSRLERPLARRAAWAATGAALTLPGLYLTVVRPWLMTWGSTASERARTYPGDDPAGPEPALRITRAVTVEAPPEKVWPWVAQIGQQRGGFYSYDWLENLAGCQIHSADRIHPEWQDVHRGDPIGMAPDFGTEVESVDPGRALVVKNWGAYVVEPAGAGRSRLVARAHVDPGLPSMAYALAIEVPHAIMERRMLLGIKQRAERAEREAQTTGPGYSRAA
jgi:hypothetical protein